MSTAVRNLEPKEVWNMFADLNANIFQTSFGSKFLTAVLIF